MFPRSRLLTTTNYRSDPQRNPHPSCSSKFHWAHVPQLQPSGDVIRPIIDAKRQKRTQASSGKPMAQHDLQRRSISLMFHIIPFEHNKSSSISIDSGDAKSVSALQSTRLGKNGLFSTAIEPNRVIPYHTVGESYIRQSPNGWKVVWSSTTTESRKIRTWPSQPQFGSPRQNVEMDSILVIVNLGGGGIGFLAFSFSKTVFQASRHLREFQMDDIWLLACQRRSTRRRSTSMEPACYLQPQQIDGTTSVLAILLSRHERSEMNGINQSIWS